MANPFSGDSFRRLSKEWNLILKSQGFEDIETDDRKLMNYDSIRFLPSSRSHRRDIRDADYFRAASNFLEHHKFNNDLDREIWACHAEGLTLNQTARLLHCSVSGMHLVIKRLKHIMIHEELPDSEEQEVEPPLSKRDELLKVVTVRPGIESDLNFVYPTWLEGLYYGNPFFSEIPKALYWERYHQIIQKLIGTPDLIFIVACLIDDPDVIVGYSILHQLSAEESCLHWIFVKGGWRRLGVSRLLLPPNATTCTHFTRLWIRIKPKEMQFNPFLDERMTNETRR